LILVKAFLKAGVLSEEGASRETITGTPQGGILSPLLANIALSVLDEHFTARWNALGPYWKRAKRRGAGEPVMKLVRYADDFVVMVVGTREDAEALRDEVSSVLAPIGLRLSEAKTRISHIATKGSTSLGGASSAGPGGAERARKPSTPTPRRSHWLPSRTRFDG
jgi:RNA-directed DNA polymerase